MKDKIKIAIDTMEFFKRVLYNGIYRQYVGNFDIAINSLEKQIPKKVVEKKFVEDVSLNYCPCCNVRFIGWGMKHCGECGQALDWSDTK